MVQPFFEWNGLLPGVDESVVLVGGFGTEVNLSSIKFRGGTPVSGEVRWSHFHRTTRKVMTCFEMSLGIQTCLDTHLSECFLPQLSQVAVVGTRARFTNGFSIAIQIRWKFRFTLTSILIQWSLQNFVHGTTAVLSWHRQKFVAIWWQATELWQDEVSIEFELRGKIR